MKSLLSAAHQASAQTIIDPAYNGEKIFPPQTGTSAWLYPRGVHETFMLRRMYRKMIQAQLLADYDMTRIPYSPANLIYQRRFSAGPVSFGVSCEYKVRLDDDSQIIAQGQRGAVSFVLEKPALVTVEIHSCNPGFCIPALKSELDSWTVSQEFGCCAKGEENVFVPTERGGDPHGETQPMIEIVLKETKPGFFDAQREIFGFIEIHSEEKPDFSLGESLPELENDDDYYKEQQTELFCKKPGVWQLLHPCAFRYIRAVAKSPCKVIVKAIFEPECYYGAFAMPSDTELTKIWMYSAYTLRLCMHYFLLDGVKRDRLPWLGDHLISMLSNACSFHDGAVCRRTLTVLGHPGISKGDINGIVDYTLWYAIASLQYQNYWDDPGFLVRQYPELRGIANALLERSQESIYLPSTGTWLFLDWTPEKKDSALQVLFVYALNALAGLAERMADTSLLHALQDRAEQVKSKLMAESYDPEKHLFFAQPGNPASGFNRYANMIAVLAGIADETMKQSIGNELTGQGMPPVGTPYMNAIECMALYRCGMRRHALQKIHAIWGGMLSEGATSFWEGYDPRQQGTEHYAFYSRPFGKSLCHAWSTGPVYLLPLILFGAEPLSGGWKTFTVSPAEDLLREGDCATIPVPDGSLRLLWKNGELQMEKPDGLELIKA